MYNLGNVVLMQLWEYEKNGCGVLNKLLSIIIPSYNEEGNIENTTNTVLKICSDANINCEILFVSDGSKDNTYSVIAEIAKHHDNVRGVEFSRNFGKEAAIMAGLSEGKGDCFVVMDCDLQHPPETIIEMYRLWEQGFEVVEGIKKSRGDESFLHKAFANSFYKIISKLTGFNMGDTSDFKLIDRRIAEVLIKIPERKTFFRALTFWVGFKTCTIQYDVAERTIGDTKWSTKSLIRYAINNIISFSSAPLDLVTYLGGIALFFSLILGLQTLIRYFLGEAHEGFTTVILLILIIGGFILVGLGIAGKYLSAIYDEIKRRPRYIIAKDTDKEKTED